MDANKICGICNNATTSITISKLVKECDCSKYNIIFNHIGCGCDSKLINILHYECINCEKIYTESARCKKCYKFYDKIIQFSDFCSICYENTKLRNPSNDNEIYLWEDIFGRWKLIKNTKQCIECKNNFIGEISTNTCNNCINIQIDAQNEQIDTQISKKINLLKVQYSSPHKLFIKHDNKIYFRNTCICGKLTEIIDIYHLENNQNKIFQCKKCNPSTENDMYKFKSNIWELSIIKIPCSLCNNILYKNLQLNFDKSFIPVILQCYNCDPSNQHLKYKFNCYGWYIDKYKIYKNNRHIWNKKFIKGSRGIYFDTAPEINNKYKCICIKCNVL